MSSIKLSSALKALVSAPHAQGGPLPAPPLSICSKLFDQLSTSARKNGLGDQTWLTLSGAALVTLNSPATLCALYSYATREQQPEPKTKREEVAAILREAGLKTISFSGIPRAINNLGALRAHIEPEVAEKLSLEPTRQLTPEKLPKVLASGEGLWTSIYAPHDDKLLKKLSQSHPDLPVHILSSHYGPLLADPPSSLSSRPEGHTKIGRILTSVVAIACLRAQGGVGPQVTSHVFGLRKSLEAGPGSAKGVEGEEVEGQEWLTSEEGCRWVLEQVDRIVEVVGNEGKSSFATRAKL